MQMTLNCSLASGNRSSVNLTIH